MGADDVNVGGSGGA